MLGDVPVIDGLVVSLGPTATDTSTGAELPEVRHSAEAMVSVCFAESLTDIVVFHARRTTSPTHAEPTPLEVGLRFRELAGSGRVRIIGALSNLLDTERCIDELNELIEVHRVVGLDLDLSGENARGIPYGELRFDDQDVIFPLIEHSRAQGVKHVSAHPASDVVDLDVVVRAFPDVQFELTCSEENVLQQNATLVTRSNLWINLAGTSALLATAPRRFAASIGTLLAASEDGADRILWSSGAMAMHPHALLEKFWAFEMPQDLIDSGHPPLTKQHKRNILGENHARMIGIDLAQLVAQVPNDDMRQAQLAGDLRSPWFKASERDRTTLSAIAARSRTISGT